MMETPMDGVSLDAGMLGDGVAVVGVMGGISVPEVAMESDTRLVWRRDLKW